MYGHDVQWCDNSVHRKKYIKVYIPLSNCHVFSNIPIEYELILIKSMF